MSQFYTSADHFTIIPAVMLALFGCAILLFDFLIFPDPRQRKWLVIFVALAEGFTGYGLYQRTMLGQVTNGKNLGLPDVSFREIAVFAPLIAWAFWIGIYPKPYFDILRKPVTEIVQRVRPGYFGGNQAVAVVEVRSAP